MVRAASCDAQCAGVVLMSHVWPQRPACRHHVLCTAPSLGGGVRAGVESYPVRRYCVNLEEVSVKMLLTSRACRSGRGAEGLEASSHMALLHLCRFVRAMYLFTDTATSKLASSHVLCECKVRYAFHTTCLHAADCNASWHARRLHPPCCCRT